MGRVRSILGGLLAAAILMAGACREGSPPDYVRLSGEAPRMDGVPPSATLLVVFWASWCPPCREEAPSLRALARDAPGALAVVTWSQDRDLAAVRSFFGGELPAELHLRLDPNAEVAKAFGAGVLPTAVLVVEGKMSARFTGAQNWDSKEMRALIGRLSSEGARRGL